MTIKEAIKLLATAKRQLINGWVYKLVKPPDAKEIIKLLERIKPVTHCQECRFSKDCYDMAGYTICENRYSPCHTSTVEKDFYCANGEPKEGEPE